MQSDFQAFSTSGSLAASRNSVLRNTYRLLGISMLPTVAGALIGINTGFSLLAGNPLVGSLVMFAVIYGLMFAIERNKNSSTGVFLLLGLTFILGFMLGPILQYSLHFRNGAQLIGLAAGGTGITFLAMSALGNSTTRNFSGMANFMLVGAVVLLVAMIANMFLQLPMLQLVIAGAFMIFSSLMITMRVNEIVNGGETNYISATLSLYVSIYNIFVSLLQLLMAFGGSDRD